VRSRELIETGIPDFTGASIQCFRGDRIGLEGALNAAHGRNAGIIARTGAQGRREFPWRKA